MDLTSEQLACLRLFRTPGIGPVGYAKLLNRCGSAVQALADLPSLCKHYKRDYTPPFEKEVLKECSGLQKIGGRFVFQGDVDWPDALTYISDCPPLLSVLGDTACLRAPCLAVVGNRNASASGMKFTHTLSKDLAINGYTVVSGLARGIDTAAHEGALAAHGATVAVLAGGVDHIYPTQNTGLYKKIIETGGCILSEMPRGMVPKHTHFPRRNRIVSGLSQAVAVVEATKQSGSLITARYALEQGREVFAVPGAPSDTRTAGPNFLLRQGAQVLESAEDIIGTPLHIRPPAPVAQAELFSPVAGEPERAGETEEQEDTSHLPPAEQLSHLLCANPVPLDDLVRASGFTEAEVTVALTELDLEGRLERHAGGGVSLK